MSRQRNWCGTFNNPGFDDPIELRAWFLTLSAKLRYVCGQLEKGKSGTPHLQLFIQTEDAKQLTWLRRNLPDGIHWEACRGSPEQNKAYCTKEATRIAGPFEYGTMKTAGQRSDLAELCDMVVSRGMKKSQILLESPESCRYFKGGMESLIDSQVQPRDPAKGLRIFVFWGPTGTGKSHRAFHGFPGAYRKASMGDNKWWQGYEGEDTAIVEDFDHRRWAIDEWLIIFDKWPVRVEVKGGSLQLAVTTFVITSNQDPATWFSGTRRTTRAQIDAVQRRLDEFASETTLRDRVHHLTDRYRAPLLQTPDTQ